MKFLPECCIIPIMEKLEIGQQIETEIVAISGDTIFLDLSSKSEGVLSRAELADENGNVSVKEGDKIKVFYLGEKNGEARFTTKISGQNADKSMIENAWNSGIPVEGVVEKEIKGGYEIKIGGARAFCPYSQMGGRKKDDETNFVGHHLVFKIQEYKNEGKNIVVSNRAILEEQRAKNLSNLESQIAVGTMVTGRITALHNYGAFVDLGGFQALLPISEISRARVENIEKVLSVGQEITAKVIKADWKNEKVSVSLKALEADPWDSVEQKFSEGDKIDGTIARVADFGVFVNLAEGIDGLVHVSELDVKKGTNLQKVFKKGDKMSVVVQGVDAKNKRISLTTSSSAQQDADTRQYLSNANDSDGETYNPFAALLKK